MVECLTQLGHKLNDLVLALLGLGCLHEMDAVSWQYCLVFRLILGLGVVGLLIDVPFESLIFLLFVFSIGLAIHM